MASVERSRRVPPHLPRTVPYIALLAALAWACEGIDVTRTSGLTDPVADAGSSSAEAEEAVPVDCSAATLAPASYEVVEGFAGSEDFVFDELGNYVGIDDDGNLVRISRDRKKTLWVPHLVAGRNDSAGMGSLPDGSIVYCNVVEGALERVYPNGAVVVVLGGLLYPNGLDIGPDGFIYVAENNAGRVRRVDPDTGEFTVVAMGLQGPNGIAFSDDPNLFYVGSFEGKGVYKVETRAPGELGQASVFARPPGSSLLDPVLACPERLEGVECVSGFYTAARCQAIANVVDCLPVDPCPGLADGDYCDYPGSRTCREQRCNVAPTCRELGAGAACEIPNLGTGTCVLSEGYLSCSTPSPCDGLESGAVCDDPFYGSGVCEVTEGYAYGRAPGEPCSDAFTDRGVCSDFDGVLYCALPNVCQDLGEGDACTDLGPLSSESAQALLRAVHASCEPAVAETLYDESGGHPYFLLELARAARARASKLAGVSLDMLLLERISHLPAAGPERARALRQARSETRRMRAEGLGWTRALATLLSAALAAQLGEKPRAILLCREACALLDAEDMELHASVACYRLGELIGGAEGATLMARAELDGQARGVRRPARFANIYCPGFLSAPADGPKRLTS